MARQLAKGSPKCNGTVDNDVNGRRPRSLRGGNCFAKCARATRALYLSRFVRGMKAEEKSALARPRSREPREFPREAPAHAKGRNRVTEAPLSCLRILEIGSTLFERSARTLIASFGEPPEGSSAISSDSIADDFFASLARARTRTGNRGGD